MMISRTKASIHLTFKLPATHIAYITNNKIEIDPIHFILLN